MSVIQRLGLRPIVAQSPTTSLPRDIHTTITTTKMEDAVIGAVCLWVVGFMIITELERRRANLDYAVERARRRAKRRKLMRQLAVLHILEAERRTQHCRQRRRMLLRITAQSCSPSVWVQKKADNWWKTVVPSFTNDQWIQHFRMSKETFQYICRRLKPELEKMDTNYRLSVPVQKRVAVALWKLATNAEYRSVAHLFGVGISTACYCVKEFCSSVEEILLPETIQMPNAEKLKELALDFEQTWGLPQCVGAIDVTHIPILAPREYRTKYFNSKGWYSIMLQAVVDGRGMFWNVYTGEPGSLDDAKVLHLSALWELAERGKLLSQQHMDVGGQDVGHYILGDEAYPPTSWLVKPFPDDGHLTQQQEVFNYKTSEARAVVRDTFGRLKGRWRCLQKRNDCSLERVQSMVLTCCVLHNLCESRGEEYRVEWDVPIPFPQPDVPLPQGAEIEEVGVRAALMHYLNPVDDD